MPEKHVVETTTYTLAELKELEGSGYDNAIEKLRESQYEDDWPLENVLDNDAVELFKACGITVPQKTEVVHVKVDGKFQWDEQHRAITKTITRDDTIWDSYNVDRGEFTLNPRAGVDEKAYLQALQWWLAGKDIRDLPALQWGQPTPPRPLTAGARQQRKFDLRSKDARIIHEQGLTIHRVGGWRSSTSDFDIDYHYDGLTEQTQNDCNDLLSDLCHEVASVLRDELEYQSSEEALTEMAESNDYQFTEEGAPWHG